MNVFAESQDSPLIKAGSNVFKVNDVKKPIEGFSNKRRQFPELRYGNNVESPNFLKVANIYDNAFSHRNQNIYNPIVYDSISSEYNHNKNVNLSADNLGYPKYQGNPDTNLSIRISKEIERYIPKLTKKMKNSLNLAEDGNIQNDNCRNNCNNDNYDNDLNKFFAYKNNGVNKYDTNKVVNLKLNDNYDNSIPYLNHNKINKDLSSYKSFDSQDIPKKKYYDNPATYLSNINEYSIKESYKINQDRILNYDKKSVMDYNCVNGQNQSMQPPKFAIDKWPLFYENYYNLANKPNAFHKKDGSFTNLINKNVVSLPIHREIKGLENKCSKEKKIYNMPNKVYMSKKTPINLKFKKIIDDNVPDCPLKRNYERILQNNNSNFKF